jgi:hypothetical protein
MYQCRPSFIFVFSSPLWLSQPKFNKQRLPKKSQRISLSDTGTSHLDAVTLRYSRTMSWIPLAVSARDKATQQIGRNERSSFIVQCVKSSTRSRIHLCLARGALHSRPRGDSKRPIISPHLFYLFCYYLHLLSFFHEAILMFVPTSLNNFAYRAIAS